MHVFVLELVNELNQFVQLRLLLVLISLAGLGFLGQHCVPGVGPVQLGVGYASEDPLLPGHRIFAMVIDITLLFVIGTGACKLLMLLKLLIGGDGVGLNE